MKKLCCFVCGILFSGIILLQAQSVGIGTNTPHPSAKLEVVDSTKGILIPRMNALQRMSIINPATGLLVYETTSGLFWYYNANIWQSISNQIPSAIKDKDGNTSVETEKNNNEDIIRFTIAANEQWKMKNSSIEPSSLGNSILIGKGSGINSSGINQKNISIGDSTQAAVTIGYNNIAIGNKTLYKNTEGFGLIAIGDSALFDQINDDFVVFGNTAVGTRAMRHNTKGYNNTALGQDALYSNTTGVFNVATGRQSLYFNIDGIDNTASGNQSLYKNTSGSVNSAFGDWAARFNTTGNFNTAIGARALYTNESGSSNTAVGVSSLNNTQPGSNNTALGYQSGLTNATGNNNTLIGSLADVTVNNLSNAGAIGYNAKVAQSNSFIIGGTGSNSVNVGIGTTTPSERLEVAGNIKAIDFITPSDKRYKIEIKPLQNSLQKIIQLQGLTYRMDNKKFSGKGFNRSLQIGFIAQDVEKIFPQVVHTESNGFKGVDYSKLVPVLVEAIKEQHAQNKILQKRIDVLEKIIMANVIEK